MQHAIWSFILQQNIFSLAKNIDVTVPIHVNRYYFILIFTGVCYSSILHLLQFMLRSVYVPASLWISQCEIYYRFSKVHEHVTVFSHLNVYDAISSNQSYKYLPMLNLAIIILKDILDLKLRIYMTSTLYLVADENEITFAIQRVLYFEAQRKSRTNMFSL